MHMVLVGPAFSAGNLHAAEIGILNEARRIGWQVQAVDPREQMRLGNPLWWQDVVEAARPGADFILVPGCCPYPEEIASIRKGLRETRAAVPIVNWNAEEVRRAAYGKRMRENSPLYDHIFHFDQSAIALYPDPSKVAWLPLGFDPARHVPVDAPKDPALYFVGSMEGKHRNRQRMVRFLEKHELPVRTFNCWDPDEVSRLYSRAAVVLNLGLFVEKSQFKQLDGWGFQQRIFEAMGSDAVILTNQPREYPQHNNHHAITPGSNIHFFEGRKHLLEQARRLLEDAELRTATAASVAATKDQHTYGARLLEMREGLARAGVL